MSISKSRTGHSLIWGIKHMFLEQGPCFTGQSFHHSLKSYSFVLRYRVLKSKTTNQSVRKAQYKMCVKITVLCPWAHILRQELLVQSQKSIEIVNDTHALLALLIFVSSDLHDDRTFTHIACIIQGLQQILCISQVLQLIKEAEVCAYHSPVYSDICGTNSAFPLLDTLTE